MGKFIWLELFSDTVQIVIDLIVYWNIGKKP